MASDRVIRLRSVLLGAALLAAPAAGQTCEAQVVALAEAPGLSAAPPPAAPPVDGLVTNGAAGPLAQAEGVIAPPPTGDAAVIEPPEIAETMPTLPAVEPAPGDDVTADAAHQVQIETLLMAARAAARAGDEEAGRERLAEAEMLLNRD